MGNVSLLAENASHAIKDMLINNIHKVGKQSTIFKKNC